ncbi:polysaccharide pyruvyl transferase family protein [Novipirellula artificiosorum]|uniref:Polysaccharide pyruvyl transferase n=1 Tax=Novipirellula artificiosorum TaxID=2528016 RepID=A0A5C6E0B1_9BACT|nr:polysaccharide pyruvyl transferase family protein [Novipirellula artificiosorum]TWU40579.1 Polysaccharide pyruvyl transferase [Novipirellula artificiosorum]
MSLRRRTFIQTTLLGVSSAALPSTAIAFKLQKRPRILLRGSWHSINIGDIAHTLGTINLISTYLPEVEIVLWPKNVKDGVKEMIQRRFPNLQIIEKEQEIQRAYQECDFYLHGSGPVLLKKEDLQKWHEETGKPYGVFGIGLGNKTAVEQRDLLNQAEFLFFRETVSLQRARDNGLECPIMEFGPDATFSTDVRNDSAANRFLTAHGLEHGKFLCCIPRYRRYPLPLGKEYWEVETPFEPEAPVEPMNQNRNEEMKEQDHALLREAIIRVVRETDMKVLVCPEDISQVSLGKEMIIDKLPEDIRKEVVWKDSFWLTDEALSTYLRSAGVFGLEQHSPIMCIGNGIPAIVGRFPEQGVKGTMWRDIGLEDWLFDIDQPEDRENYVPAVLELAKHPEAARDKAAKAHGRVERFQQRMVEVLKEAIGG